MHRAICKGRDKTRDRKCAATHGHSYARARVFTCVSSSPFWCAQVWFRVLKSCIVRDAHARKLEARRQGMYMYVRIYGTYSNVMLKSDEEASQQQRLRAAFTTASCRCCIFMTTKRPKATETCFFTSRRMGESGWRKIFRSVDTECVPLTRCLPQYDDHDKRRVI